MRFELALGVDGHPGSSDAFHKRTAGAMPICTGSWTVKWLILLKLCHPNPPTIELANRNNPRQEIDRFGWVGIRTGRFARKIRVTGRTAQEIRQPVFWPDRWFLARQLRLSRPLCAAFLVGALAACDNHP